MGWEFSETGMSASMADEFRGLPPRTVPTQPLAKLIANQAPKVPGTQNVGARHVVFWCQALCFGSNRTKLGARHFVWAPKRFASIELELIFRMVASIYASVP